MLPAGTFTITRVAPRGSASTYIHMKLETYLFKIRVVIFNVKKSINVDSITSVLNLGNTIIRMKSLSCITFRLKFHDKQSCS